MSFLYGEVIVSKEMPVARKRHYEYAEESILKKGGMYIASYTNLGIQMFRILKSVVGVGARV